MQNPSLRCLEYREGPGTKPARILEDGERRLKGALILYGQWRRPRSHVNFAVLSDAAEWV